MTLRIVLIVHLLSKVIHKLKDLLILLPSIYVCYGQMQSNSKATAFKPHLFCLLSFIFFQRAKIGPYFLAVKYV